MLFVAGSSRSLRIFHMLEDFHCCSYLACCLRFAATPKDASKMPTNCESEGHLRTSLIWISLPGWYMIVQKGYTDCFLEFCSKI